MKPTIKFLSLLSFCIPLLTGCEWSGNKHMGVEPLYFITATLALIMLAGYAVFQSNKDRWMLLLLLSVFTVDLGYLGISMSKTVETALTFNRLSYFGSVFLPFAMLMLILRFGNIKYKRRLPYLLLGLSVVVFFVVATQGYLNLYYKEVHLITVGNASVLKKTYGPLHHVYTVYLLTYLIANTTVAMYSLVKKKASSSAHGLALLFAVFINIGIWTFEQFVDIDIELLSVSYIISEFFLLVIELIMDEQKKRINSIIKKAPASHASQSDQTDDEKAENLELIADPDAFIKGINSLTRTERLIFSLYMEGRSTKEIISQLEITENTLKFHNKNIYSKTGVKSRKQLCNTARTLNVDIEDDTKKD